MSRPRINLFRIVVPVAALLLGAAGGAGSAAADEETDLVLCLFGDECRLTTVERCLLKGGTPSPSWEECLPRLPDAADSIALRGESEETGDGVAEECTFPAEFTILGRNRLVYATHAYEVAFGHGDIVRVDYDEAGFVVADSLLHAPHPGPRVVRAHLERLGAHLGLRRGWAENLTGNLLSAPAPVPQPVPSREEACILLRMMKLLGQARTPLEVRLDRGEISLIMAPLDERPEADYVGPE